MEAHQFPVLTFQELQEGPKLRDACSSWGCFRLVQHGVPSELMAEMKTVAGELFKRPLDVKQRIKQVAQSGYRPPTERNPCYEGFSLNASYQSIASFSSDLELSADQSKVASSLGLANYDFEDYGKGLRVNKYAINERGSLGVREHTDKCFLTILQDDENFGGLQVRNPSATYVDVATVASSFFVNIGDQAMEWSNGELHNVTHRVLCQDVGKRLSIATFFNTPKRLQGVRIRDSLEDC